MQACAGCGKSAGPEEFVIRKRKDLEGHCRACRKRIINAEYMARWRAGNPEASVEKQREFRRDNPGKAREYRKAFQGRHPEKKRESDRRYREANAEYLVARYARYYRDNQEAAKARAKRWREENPVAYRELKQRRRARVRGSVAEPVDLDPLWTGACAICGGLIDADLRWPAPGSKSVDHIIPLCKGGAHVQENLQWTHLECNLKKGSRLPVDTAERSPKGK